MAKLKLGRLQDDTPVKITLELPAGLARDLAIYGQLLADPGKPPVTPARLIVPMLERFIATDRGFAKARKAGGNTTP